MRSLFILRGAPGSGKSTWVKENHLEPYTLSADQIRRQIQSPVLDEEGKYGTCQDNDGEVWKLLFDMLEKRMERGDLTIVDATHYKSSLISRYKDLENKYRYRVYVVNFNIPEEEIIKRNESRQEWEVVPNDIISKMIISLRDDTEIKKAYKILTPEEAANLINSPLEPINLDALDKVVIFGDIHGCYEPLQKYFSENPYNENTSYIFVGDYIDRGIQNKEVLQFMLANYRKPNIVFLEGNHEKWLKIYTDKEYNIDDYTEEKTTYKDLQLNKIVNELKHYTELYTSKATKIKQEADEIYKLYKEQNIEEIFYKFERINALERVKEYNQLYNNYTSLIKRLEYNRYILLHEQNNSFKAVTDVLKLLDDNKLGYSLNIDRSILEKYNIKFKDVKDNPIKSNEFIKNTLPQIKELDKAELRQLCRKFIQLSYFEFRGQKYLVTHGGLPKMPTLKTPTYQIVKGVGSYASSSDIDRLFTQNEKDVIQIHGHRNVFGESAKITERAYNLNSEIEFGQPLRVMEITDHIEIKEYENTVFQKPEEQVIEEKTELQVLKEMVDDKYIDVKELNDNIVSINFSHDAFYDKKWNEKTCKARGLFVDKTNGNIVARSFEKFFHWGEMDYTKSPELKKNLQFPVTCWKKENGFLGLITKYNNNVKFFTKSSDEGDFVNWFKGVLCDTYNVNMSSKCDLVYTLLPLFEPELKCGDEPIRPVRTYSEIYDILVIKKNELGKYKNERREEQIDFENDETFKNLTMEIKTLENVLNFLTNVLKNKLKDKIQEGKTYIFECIDIKHDRHMIKYNQSHVVLLNVVTNSLINPIFSPYAEIINIALELNVKYKQVDLTFNNWEDLYEWRQKEKESYDVRHEGWVIEDSTGFNVKMKTRFYSFWKDMRKTLQSLQGGRELKKIYKTKEEILVTKILQRYTRDELKKMDIIDIEDIFYQEYEG